MGIRDYEEIGRGGGGEEEKCLLGYQIRLDYYGGNYTSKQQERRELLAVSYVPYIVHNTNGLNWVGFDDCCVWGAIRQYMNITTGTRAAGMP